MHGTVECGGDDYISDDELEAVELRSTGQPRAAVPTWTSREPTSRRNGETWGTAAFSFSPQRAQGNSV